MVLITSSTDNITLKIDPSVVLATRKYVDDKVLELKVYVDDLMAKHIAAADPHTQYAPKESPTLTGTPKAPTAPAGTNTTQIASTAFVQAVVTALNNALALKAPLASPALTGTPTAPTAAQTVNNTQIATTAFVKSAIAALVASSPAALDTLNELAAALGNDPNFATTMTNALAGKQPLDSTLTTLSGKTAAGIIEYLGLVNSSGMVGRLVSIKKFTSSGTYTPTAGTRFVKVRLVGAGGAGGGAAASTVSGYLAAGRGGGGGSYGETTLIDVASVLSVAVIVGSAGIGSAGSSGTDGGSSSFGSYITAPGGNGGGMGASGPANNSLVSDLSNSGKECTGTDIFISIPGEGGGGQMSLSTGTAKGGHGGSSILGTGGSAYTGNQQGGYGWGFGAGGAGSVTVYAQGTSATAGGHGSNGIVIIEEFA